jgi:AbiU2
VELVDHSDVVERIVEETRSQWPVGDGFGQEQANRARSELTQAISDAREILKSKRLASIMNLRDKHLAHSLSKTRRERKIGPVAPMKYGDEREVLSRSLAIVEVFYRWVNSTGFSFADSRQIDRKNAEALWTRCTFDIKSRTH